jgi:SPP1 gp7 family putative phage head morphogenesis protein
MSVNSQLQDFAITHSHYVERYKAFELGKIRKIFKQSEADIRLSLLNADITDWSRARYERQLASVIEIQKAYNTEYLNTLRDDMRNFGGAEAKFQRNTIKDVLSIQQLNIVAPSAAQVWASAKFNPLLFEADTALDFMNFIGGVSEAKLQALTNTLRYGYVTGKTSAQIARDLVGTRTRRGAFNWTRNKVDTVVRTATNHMSQIARKEVYNQNVDLIKGYQWIATLDDRTTDICQYRDGKVWIFNETARDKYSGAELLDAEVYPPAHWGCRSATGPVLVSWQELGVEASEIPEATRASMDGSVPQKTTYREWLERQSAGTQKEVLGATRYKMYQSGEISINKFYGKDGRYLTLDQLEKMEYNIPKL